MGLWAGEQLVSLSFLFWGKRLVWDRALSRQMAIKALVSVESHQCKLAKGEFRKPTIETISIERWKIVSNNCMKILEACCCFMGTNSG